MAMAAIAGATGIGIELRPVDAPTEEPQDQGGIGVPGFSRNPGRPRPGMSGETYRNYRTAIEKTAAMASNLEANRLANDLGLNVMNLTWEDTGRYKGSSVGPNISDMTIQVINEGRAQCMPVIRYPNFSDKTCDLDPYDFTLLVGNQQSRPLRRISLREFLASPTRFLTRPSSWAGEDRSLLADRDSKVLVSAQACFLPVPKTGTATFNPVLFNYQSRQGDPAVLTILATREGTSVTVIDNVRDAFQEGNAWGQRLFHNASGERASLTGQRLTDFQAAETNGGNRKSSGAGLSMVMLIQVPLKQREQPRYKYEGFGGGGFGGASAAAPMMEKAKSISDRSDVEAAVIGHGEMEGPFTEIDNLPIRRDPQFPIRVTVQFYKATSNGVVSPEDVAAVKREIDRVYSQSDSVGSLVTDGETGRPTEYEGLKVQPAWWWSDFWRRHQANTGDSREVAMEKLRRLLGQDYTQRPVSGLYLNDLLRRK